MAGILSAVILGSSVASADTLPYTKPLYETDVTPDVVYSTAKGYWAEGPSEFSASAQRWTDVIFKTRQDLELKMDIYTPRDGGAQSRPLLLMMHGGAYAIGSKSERGQTEWCRYFASLGYVAVSIDYRLGFKPRLSGLLRAESDALDDARAALACLLDMPELKIDPQRVFAAGTSAGGALALGLAYDSPSCHIRAIGNLWGYVRDLSILENADVPMLSFQSELDPVVPYGCGYLLNRKVGGMAYGTKAVHDRAAELGIRCEHFPCPEKGHRLHLDADGVLTPRFYDIRDGLARFFASIMAL